MHTLSSATLLILFYSYGSGEGCLNGQCVEMK